jgi:hypothetical protein
MGQAEKSRRRSTLTVGWRSRCRSLPRENSRRDMAKINRIGLVWMTTGTGTRQTPTIEAGIGIYRNQMRLAAFASIEHCARAAGVEKQLGRAHESPSEC